MGRDEFLKNHEVAAFVSWLADHASSLSVDLNIPRSNRVPERVQATVRGFNSVIELYLWRACWHDQDQQRVESIDWNSTVDSLKRLRNTLKSALDNKSDEKTLKACHAILEWGGDRNGQNGARPFLNTKYERKELVRYIASARDAFSLRNANLNELGCIERINSMLSKVHALAASDGLPIYDSRVAAAIACLVELFRISTGRNLEDVPTLLLFPTMPNERRRRVTHIHAGALIPQNATLYYNRHYTTSRWASAKLRLGWIINAVLDQSPQLLTSQPHSRMHAFEACLFMIGYDVQCLSGNLTINL